MANVTFYLENINKEDIMCWNVCSQCANNPTIVLRDSEKVYDVIEKRNRSCDLLNLGNGNAIYGGAGELRLEISISESSRIQTSKSAEMICDLEGKNVGCTYTYCIEDYTDNDFSDLYITVASWRKKEEEVK